MNANTGVSASFKLLVLVILAVQNSGISLATRYSQGVLHEQYAVISTVIVSEIVKLITSLFMIAKAQNFAMKSFSERVGLLTRTALPMAIPGLIYLVQNKLTYIGLKNLESATYSMLSQIKLLTTAVLAVIILRKRLYSYQWRALVLLFIGVVLIQSRPAKVPSTPTESSGDPYTGTMAVLGVTSLSALAGIYFEYMLKGSATLTMWDRNAQLSFFGIVFGLVSMPFSEKEFSFIRTYGFFGGYSYWTVLVVLLASLGGLLVSAAVAYTDNILKNFATSAAILLTSFISWWIFRDLQVDVNFIAGTSCVLMAVFNYSEDIKGLARELGMIDAVTPVASSSVPDLKTIKSSAVEPDDDTEEIEADRPLLSNNYRQ